MERAYSTLFISVFQDKSKLCPYKGFRVNKAGGLAESRMPFTYKWRIANKWSQSKLATTFRFGRRHSEEKTFSFSPVLLLPQAPLSGTTFFSLSRPSFYL